MVDVATAPTSDALKTTPTDKDVDGAGSPPVPPNNTPNHIMPKMTNTLSSNILKPTSINNNANGVQVASATSNVLKPSAVNNAANGEQSGPPNSAAFKPVSASNDNSDGDQSGSTPQATVSVSTLISNGALTSGITQVVQ